MTCLFNIETTIVFFWTKNYCKQAKHIFSRIISPRLKFSKRQKSLTYTSFANANLKRQPQNHTKNNNLNHK